VNENGLRYRYKEKFIESGKIIPPIQVRGVRT